LFLQKFQIAHDPAHLHIALILIITNFRACWEHLTDYGSMGRVKSFYWVFSFENTIETNCKAAETSPYLI